MLLYIGLALDVPANKAHTLAVHDNLKNHIVIILPVHTPGSTDWEHIVHFHYETARLEVLVLECSLPSLRHLDLIQFFVHLIVVIHKGNQILRLSLQLNGLLNRQVHAAYIPKKVIEFCCCVPALEAVCHKQLLVSNANSELITLLATVRTDWNDDILPTTVYSAIKLGTKLSDNVLLSLF